MPISSQDFELSCLKQQIAPLNINKKNHQREASIGSKLGGFMSAYQKSSTVLPMIGTKDSSNTPMRQQSFMRENEDVSSPYQPPRDDKQENSTSGIQERDSRSIGYSNERLSNEEFRAL